MAWNLFFSLVTSQLFFNNHADAECARHRQPWHMISDDERMHFVLGFQQLRNNGVLSAFCATHHLEGVAFQDIHKTSEFFFWHSYFVWEVESQFRNLGDDYACFSMPYWDVTNDALYLEMDPAGQDLPIFNSMVGSDGDINNNNCVDDELWNSDKYGTEFLCSEDEESPNCCLKRQRNAALTELANMAEITNAIKHRRFRVFQDSISLYHGKVHKFFAQTNRSHMWANNAAEDPLFVLLHSFVDYIRFMRSDCFDFDKIGIEELDEYIPFVFDSYALDEDDIDIKPTLDTAMAFAFICENELSVCNNMDITPRIMFDASEWGISYELGTFWSNNAELQSFCGENINNTWFYNQQYIINGLVNHSSDYSMFMTLTILVLIILVLFVYTVIKQYVYKKGNDETMKKLMDDNAYGNAMLYGAI